MARDGIIGRGAKLAYPPSVELHPLRHTLLLVAEKRDVGETWGGGGSGSELLGKAWAVTRNDICHKLQKQFIANLPKWSSWLRKLSLRLSDLRTSDRRSSLGSACNWLCCKFKWWAFKKHLPVFQEFFLGSCWHMHAEWCPTQCVLYNIIH